MYNNPHLRSIPHRSEGNRLNKGVPELYHGYQDDDVPALPFNVSSREIEVLQLLVDGYNYKAIGEKLFISYNTVKKHVSNIYEKLHVTSKAQAIKVSHYYNLLK